jgi:diguanylate cyclase (GGDEF)-like protein/PAS domain S-box-containing protein
MTSRARWAWTVLALVLFVVIGVARFRVDYTSSDGIHLLWTVPMAILALVHGLRGGIAACALALTMFSAWAVAGDVPIGAAGLAMRAIAVVGFGLFVGYLSSGRIRAGVASRRWFEMSNDLLVEADLDGWFTRVNRRWEEALGWTPEELTSRPMLDFVHPEDRARTAAAARTLDSAPGELVNFENRYLAKDGSYRWLQWNSRSDEHRKYAVARDVTERKALLDQLEALATTDSLTGLANRRAWDDELLQAVARARRTEEPLVLAMLDLDHFKAYNDERGHLAGDQLLVTLAATWSEALRTTDVLSRYGGEEFALLLPACTASEAEATLARLRAAMPDGVTCSAGLALLAPGESAPALVGRADAALYEAKRAGRDQVVVAGTAPSLP